ncbi:MAG: hypothetical protein HY303_04000 [Candidatus Wallbacteria bacterium]|nr:hypothetical protein [Candidatus Wallbacteria bacterium]
MSLTRWRENGWLVPHEATAAQVAQLLAIAERDLAVADEIDDLDWKFGIAYNAVLKLCTVALNASGLRPSREMHHYRTLLALPLILGPDRKDDAAYLDQCRMKRNHVARIGFSGRFETYAPGLGANFTLERGTAYLLSVPAARVVSLPAQR